MTKYSTRQAAKILGLRSHNTLAEWIRHGKIPPPERISVGKRIVHVWTREQIAHVRKIMPDIPDGRKVPHQKRLAAAKRRQARAAAKADSL